MRRTLATLVLALAALGIFTACSTSGSPETQAVCTALDQGAVPGVALVQAYRPTDEASTMDAMHRGATDIREACPQHEDAAVAFDNFSSLMDQVPPGYSSANGEVNPGGNGG